VFAGTFEEMQNKRAASPPKYIAKELNIPLPDKKKKMGNISKFWGQGNNLKGLDVKFPLNILTVLPASVDRQISLVGISFIRPEKNSWWKQ